MEKQKLMVEIYPETKRYFSLKKTYEFTHGKIVKFPIMEIIQVLLIQVKEIIKQ